jgi:hypothetical protein
MQQVKSGWFIPRPAFPAAPVLRVDDSVTRLTTEANHRTHNSVYPGTCAGKIDLLIMIIIFLGVMANSVPLRHCRMHEMGWLQDTTQRDFASREATQHCCHISRWLRTQIYIYIINLDLTVLSWTPNNRTERDIERNCFILEPCEHLRHQLATSIWPTCVQRNPRSCAVKSWVQRLPQLPPLVGWSWM